MDRLRSGGTSASGGTKEKSPSITIDGTAPIGLTQEEERMLKELWRRAEAEEREELLAQVSACSEEEEADEDERAIQAATALQALYRGHSTRSQLPDREERHYRATLQGVQTLEGSACRITCLFPLSFPLFPSLPLCLSLSLSFLAHL